MWDSCETSDTIRCVALVIFDRSREFSATPSSYEEKERRLAEARADAARDGIDDATINRIYRELEEEYDEDLYDVLTALQDTGRLDGFLTPYIERSKGLPGGGSP